jgi:beta-glucanase (GH16 family)
MKLGNDIIDGRVNERPHCLWRFSSLFFTAMLWSALIPPVMAAGADDPHFPPKGFKLVLEETFESPVLNRELWETKLKVFGREGDRYHNSSYLNYIVDDDVLLEAGLLRLRASRCAIRGDDPDGTYQYTAGMVSSHDRFVFTYGYIEIRARFPGGKGVWPCFWLMPQSHQWPPEFDIAEYYGAKKLMHLGLCHGNFPEVNWASSGNVDVDFEGSWNTFGLLWLPGQAKWIQNGEVKHETEGVYVPSTPMYIILSNGVSSRFGPSGAPTPDTAFPNFFEIDYLRVWSFEGGRVDANPQIGTSLLQP